MRLPFFTSRGRWRTGRGRGSRLGRGSIADYTEVMQAKRDVEFLAVLVHRGHLDKGTAESLYALLKEGEDLDRLLESEIGWEPREVARLRRTQGGRIPEIPGHEILANVGTGGTADVFQVREKRSGRVLALKVLKAECTRHAPTRKAFVAEARLLERLSHPGLVQGFGVARSGQTYFSRMEFIDGRTLLEYLDEGRAFDEMAALRIVLTVAEVLAYLAEQNVIHRDVKPGNVMLDQNAVVKLIDLGFAAGAEEGPSPDDSTVGTVHYLSPEQARGGAVPDMRADIYSCGVTLFHLVVGRLPFDGSDDREVLRMQVMESLSSPELKSRKLSPHLQYFVEKMMAKDVADRYQSWEELLVDIRSQLEGRESLDYEKEVRERARRTPPRTRRRRR